MTIKPKTENEKEEQEWELLERIPKEWLKPVHHFQNNDYPCPRCGKQLPRYNEGIHCCAGTKHFR
jgi:hypothetical protein